ncbi:MAG: hypothetical protein K6F61_04485 [Clostridiales bacterium]|nr:hypothetical protein [Clostridiales bacterium]
MNKLQKLLCLLLSLLLLVQAPFAALAEGEPEETEFPDELIVGHPTVTKGDFFTELFGNDTADIDVRALIHGYNLVNWDQSQGTYVMDPSVVKEFKVAVDEYGNKVYQILLWDNLFYSDGTPITAWDYAFSVLLMMSPEVEAIGGKIYRAEHLLGYDEYIATRKKILAGEELTDNDVLSLGGVEVHNDYEIWFTLDNEFLPYFFETGLLMTVPYPISVIAPGNKVYQMPGGGIYLADEDDEYKYTKFTPELLKKTILDPETGYNSHPSVVSGPYKMVSWDAETGEGHYEINPYFKGAWMQNDLPGPDYSGPVQYVQVKDDAGNPMKTASGGELWLMKPTIEKIAFVVADNDTMIQQLVDGELHLINKVTYGPTIAEGLQAVGKGEIAPAQNYPRIGLSFLTFTYDWPTVHDKEVRQAIAWCMDRDLMTSHYCGYTNDTTGTFASFGTRVDGYFGIEQWEYKLVNGQYGGFPVNIVERVVPDSDDPEADKEKREELVKKYKYLYVYEADYEKAIAAWEVLAEEWKDTLVEYTVDLKKAEDLLIKAGWTLNRNGEDYQKGVDDVRCKNIDGTLVALDLKMMYPEGNHMAEIMQNDIRTENDPAPYPALRNEVQPDHNATTFVGNLAEIGIKLTMVPEKMEDLLKSYYRQTERTTDMIYLATNFHVIVDPSITYSTDKTKNHEIWNNTYSDDEDLWYRAVNMRKTEPGDVFEYVSKWISFQERYNEVLPTIPIYSNIYFDFLNSNLQNYWITGQVTWSQAILPAYFALEDYDAASRQAQQQESDEEDGDDGFETLD